MILLKELFLSGKLAVFTAIVLVITGNTGLSTPLRLFKIPT